MNLKISLQVLVVLTLINCALSVNYNNYDKFNNYKLISKRFDGDLSSSFFKNAINYSILYNNQNCQRHIEQLLESIHDFNEIWALQLIDAWGKFPAGLLWGHLKDYGNFDECLNITHEFDENLKLPILNGQYCTGNIPIKEILSTIQPNLIKHIKSDGFQLIPQPLIGICVPDSCSPDFIDNQLKIAIENRFDIEINGTLVQSDSCYIRENIQFEIIDYVAIGSLTTIGILMVLSTCYEYYIIKSAKNPIKFLMVFSILTNGKQLFRMQSTRSVHVIECLNGIRSLSIIWIVLGHSYATFVQVNLINSIEILKWVTEPISMVILFGTVSVDTFFFISGLLVIWVVFKELEKSNGKLNVPLMYLHRYIRLTPIVAFTILFAVSLNRYIGNGPNWKQMQQLFTTTCQDSWWQTLLYVQNYAAAGKMCLGHTWYLAVDTQLYILSPLILWPLWKWGKKCLILIFILIILSMGCTFATFMKYDFIFMMYGETDTAKADERMRLTYYATQTRMSPWLIGLIFGYFAFHMKNHHIKLSKIKIICGWTIAIGIIGAVLFGPYNRIKSDAERPGKIESAFYESCSRVAWSLAISWIVFACQKGYGGIVNTILCWDIWQPFSRISYSIYIIHLVIQSIIAGNSKSDLHFSNFETILKFWGEFGLTVCVAILMVLAIELPIIRIEQFALFGKRSATIRPATFDGTSQQDLIKNNNNIA